MKYRYEFVTQYGIVFELGTVNFLGPHKKGEHDYVYNKLHS